MFVDKISSYFLFPLSIHLCTNKRAQIEHETHDPSYKPNVLGSKNKAPKLNENRVAAASDG